MTNGVTRDKSSCYIVLTNYVLFACLGAVESSGSEAVPFPWPRVRQSLFCFDYRETVYPT